MRFLLKKFSHFSSMDKIWVQEYGTMHESKWIWNNFHVGIDRDENCYQKFSFKNDYWLDWRRLKEIGWRTKWRFRRRTCYRPRLWAKIKLLSEMVVPFHECLYHHIYHHFYCHHNDNERKITIPILITANFILTKYLILYLPQVFRLFVKRFDFLKRHFELSLQHC